MSTLSFLKIVKNLLMAVAILVGGLILLTSVQPTDAEQEEIPTWRMDMRHGCFYIDYFGNRQVDMTCVRASCAESGGECTWEWGGACFKIEGGYCFE